MKKPTPRQLAAKDDLRRMAKMLKHLRRKADDATLIRFAIAEHRILPIAEDLSDWSAHHAPRTMREMVSMETRLDEFLKATTR